MELLGNSNLGQFLGTENIPAFAGVGNGSRIRSITSNSGNAGSVKINADRVTLQGGTRIDVSTLASGRGGSIEIQAKTVELTDGGQLISTTNGSGQAGKIDVRADKTVVLNGTDSTFEAKRAFISLISVLNTQPDARQALTDYLQNPNRISQQAVLNYWQQVNNNLAERQILQQYFTLLQNTPTARSTLQSFLTQTARQTSLSDYNIFLNVGNTSGIVTVTILGNDPDRGLLPDPIVPSAPTLAQTCAGSRDRQASQFIDSGKGGVTPSAKDTLGSNNLWLDARVANPPVSIPPIPPTIEAAQGWKGGNNRTVILTSQPIDNSEPTAKIGSCTSR